MKQERSSPLELPASGRPSRRRSRYPGANTRATSGWERRNHEDRMAFTASQLDEIVAWCANRRDLVAERKMAQRQFFGEDDDRPVEYWPGAGDPTSRQRRFLGWFTLDFRLPDGRQPAEVAATSLYRGGDLIEALDALRCTRFMLAIVRSTDGGRSTFLELEDEHFEVRCATWAQVLTRGGAVVAHLMPVRNRFWLAGPGWLEWPIGIGPNMRRELKRFQFDPIQAERLLQSRVSDRDDRPIQDSPEDTTLEAAVARMTTAANEAGPPELLLSVEQWRALVLRHMSDTDPNSYFTDVTNRVGPARDIEDLNLWLALANNIWNATPQPERGGKTALELTARWRSGLRQPNR